MSEIISECNREWDTPPTSPQSDLEAAVEIQTFTASYAVSGGEYVLLKDHKTIVAALEKERDEAKQTLSKVKRIVEVVEKFDADLTDKQAEVMASFHEAMAWTQVEELESENAVLKSQLEKAEGERDQNKEALRVSMEFIDNVSSHDSNDRDCGRHCLDELIKDAARYKMAIVNIFTPAKH